MKARLKVNHNDFGRVELLLKRLAGRVPANSARALRRAAVRIRDRAETYTPEDEGHLAESIRIVERKGENGRIEFDIIVGGQTVTRHNGREVNLDQYALIIHESYSQFRPGPNTIAKRAIYGEDKVGERFMDRAVEDDKQLAQHDIIKTIKETIREAGGA